MSCGIFFFVSAVIRTIYVFAANIECLNIYEYRLFFSSLFPPTLGLNPYPIVNRSFYLFLLKKKGKNVFLEVISEEGLHVLIISYKRR